MTDHTTPAPPPPEPATSPPPPAGATVMQHGGPTGYAPPGQENTWPPPPPAPHDTGSIEPEEAWVGAEEDYDEDDDEGGSAVSDTDGTLSGAGVLLDSALVIPDHEDGTPNPYGATLTLRMDTELADAPIEVTMALDDQEPSLTLVQSIVTLAVDTNTVEPHTYPDVKQAGSNSLGGVVQRLSDGTGFTAGDRLWKSTWEVLPERVRGIVQLIIIITIAVSAATIAVHGFIH